MNPLQRVLVTGADGFIGSHLVERLLGDGVEVTALCLYNSPGSLGWLEEIPGVRDRVNVQLGDIRDSEFVDHLIEDHSAVFHLAALIAIPYSYTAPRSFVETNVIGTRLARRVGRLGLDRVVFRDRGRLWGSVDLARGRMDQSCARTPANRFQYVERADDVGLHK